MPVFNRFSVSTSKIAFALIVLLASFSASAQIATGVLSGRVTDPTGAAIPSAKVSLTKTDTGLVIQAISNAQGFYTFAALQTGPYRVEAALQGFKKAQATLTVAVGQTIEQDLMLSVGDQAETVTVVANVAQQLNTDNSTLSFLVGQRQVNDLPLNGRNPYALAALAPGIVPGGSFGAGLSTARGALVAAATNNFEANGGIAGSNEILFDGIAISLCCQGQPALTPSVEIVDQFKVITSVPSAQFGRSSGGILNIASKTGTNKLHGDVYEFLRNDQLDAADFFQKRSGNFPIPGRHDFRPPHRFNQFGSFVNGPVYLPFLYNGHDKTFFTFGYEGTRNTLSSFSTTTVPTVLMRRGIFTEAPTLVYDPYQLTSSGTAFTRAPLAPGCDPTTNTCYVAGRYVANINPAAQKLLTFFPQPTNSALVNNYSYSKASTDYDNQFNFRVDHNFSGSDRAFVRGSRVFNRHHENDLFNQTTGPNAVDQSITAYLFALGNSWSITPSMLLQVTYGFAYQKNFQIPQNYTNYNPTDYGFTGNFAAEQQLLGIPYIGINGLTTLGYGANSNRFSHYNHVLTSLLLWQHGKHNFTFGHDGRMIIENELTVGNAAGTLSFDATMTRGPDPTAATPNGQSPFDSFAAFLTGTPTSATLQRQLTLATNQWYNALFAQDDWRIMPKLVLNLGVRYEIETGLKERYNRWADFDPNAANPYSTTSLPFTGGAQYLGANGGPSNMWQTYYDKVAPRIGFAYSPKDGTVARGGYGLLYLPTSQRFYVAGTLGFSQTTTQSYSSTSVPTSTLDNPFPNGVALPAGPAAGVQAGTGTGVSGLLYKNPVPYVQQWNFGIEQAIGKGVTLRLNYAGSKGTKLPMNVRPNDLQPQYFGAPGDTTQVNYLLQQVANPLESVSAPGSLSGATVARAQLLSKFPQYPLNTSMANSSLTINQDDIGANSYNALQVGLDIRPSKNLSSTINYTWSKLLGNVIDLTTGAFNATGTPAIQNYYLLGDERSVLATDVPHRIVGAVNYSLPFGRGQRFGGDMPRWADEIVGEWKLNSIVNVQSGYPLSFTEQGTAQFAGARPSYVPAIHPLTSGSTHNRLGGAGQSQSYLNATAFRLSQSFELGNVPRSVAAIRSPLGFQDDLSAIKIFPIHNAVALEFRFEAFNFLNKAAFGLPNTTVGSTSFGYITSSGNQRNVQAALKLQF